MAKGIRRTPQEVHALALKAHAAIEGGKPTEEVFKELDLAESVYRRWLKKGGPRQVIRTKVEKGRVRADSLPPRPKKGGKRVPKQVDMNDVGSVATRIARLDKKLRDVEDWVKERVELVARLLVLLKKKPKVG